MQCQDCPSSSTRLVRGRCPKCYAKWYRRTYHTKPRPGTLESDIIRYLSKIDPDPTVTGCYLWLDTEVNGYGRFHSRGKKERSHRWFYTEVLSVRFPEQFPPLKPGEMLRHDCDNRACQTPTHLRPGSAADNVADMMRRGRRPTKVDDAMREAILAAREDACTFEEIASKFGISDSTVSRIVHNQVHPERFLAA